MSVALSLIPFTPRLPYTRFLFRCFSVVPLFILSHPSSYSYQNFSASSGRLWLRFVMLLILFRCSPTCRQDEARRLAERKAIAAAEEERRRMGKSKDGGGRTGGEEKNYGGSSRKGGGGGGEGGDKDDDNAGGSGREGGMGDGKGGEEDDDNDPDDGGGQPSGGGGQKGGGDTQGMGGGKAEDGDRDGGNEKKVRAFLRRVKIRRDMAVRREAKVGVKRVDAEGRGASNGVAFYKYVILSRIV